jgi:hypothetical protein
MPDESQRLSELVPIATEYVAAMNALDALPIGSDKTEAEWVVYNAACDRWDAAIDAWCDAIRPFEGDGPEHLAANLVLALGRTHA